MSDLQTLSLIAQIKQIPPTLLEGHNFDPEAAYSPKDGAPVL